MSAIRLAAALPDVRVRDGHRHRHPVTRDKMTIKLPATEDGKPDWGLMERFMAALPFSAVIAAPR